MGSNHFMFAPEETWGEWVTDEAQFKALPVRTAAINPTQGFMTPQETGGGRGTRTAFAGEIGVAGQLTTSLYPQTLGYLIRSMFGSRTKTAAGTGYRNKLLIDDEIAFDSFSIQKRYRDDLAESITGAKCNGFTISARTREFAQVTIPFIAKDAAASGGNWSNGDPAPAVIDPVPYPATYLPPLKFYEGVLKLGGAVTNVSNELTVAGGVEQVSFDNIEITVAEGLSADAYGVNLGDRTVQDISEGNRAITVRFDPNFANISTEFYEAWRASTDAVVQLFFQGPEYDDSAHKNYEYVITVPCVRYSEGSLPELNSQYGLRRVTVQGAGIIHPTLAVDLGVVIQGKEDLTLWPYGS